MQRIVLHMDLDYFYAQVEEVEYPEYKGKPLVICVYSGRDKTSGAVGTANYEARMHGVRSGMPIKTAMAKLGEKQAVFLPVRMEKYAEVSSKIMEEIAG
ncbi:DNA polymerase IV, partial [Candidatus Micrarchaeota archaeon]|nr:DNA polymerase IV [Candidatus Micrarchaeota archaeon]